MKNKLKQLPIINIIGSKKINCTTEKITPKSIKSKLILEKKCKKT